MSDSPTKKRKANDGSPTALDSNHGGGGFLSSWLGYFTGRRDEDDTTPTASTTCGGENLTQKMDRMEKMMIRMEEKLTTVSSLERRCEKLEDSLVRHHEYSNMLVRNQGWKYSTPVHSAEYWENNGYDEDVAEYLSENSECLKGLTEKLRRGEIPEDFSGKGIDLDWDGPILDDDASDEMRHHWIEFTDALKQSTPAFGVLPDGCETYFALENVQLNINASWQLKDALMNKPFQTLKLVNKVDVRDEGMKIVDIIDIMKSNNHLRKLTIGNNRIQLGNMKNLFSAVCRGSIVELDIGNCFENGLGEEMMTYLVTNGGLAKLKRLGLGSNGITSTSITTLADFLATNPPLKELYLEDNLLVDNDAEVLANALRTNTSLRKLQLTGNSIRDAGKEAFRLVLYNDSSLNSVADSNHSCFLDGVRFHSWNMSGFWKDRAWHEASESFNRARKIYRLLSERNRAVQTSNVQYFDEIDVKILPSMLKAVQRYAIAIHPYDSVKAMSIVYEVMRKWDKVFPFYADRGNNDIN